MRHVLFEYELNILHLLTYGRFKLNEVNAEIWIYKGQRRRPLECFLTHSSPLTVTCVEYVALYPQYLSHLCAKADFCEHCTLFKSVKLCY